MKIIIILIFLNICLVILTDNTKDNKEYKKTERRVKALACTILSNRHPSFFQNTKKELKELLFKNKIIKKNIEAKEKIPEFLAALCYTKIGIYQANQIIDKISQKQLDILEDEDEQYKNLFEIEPDLNYTKIKRIMNRVNKIMNKIVEEEKKLKKKQKGNETFVEEDFSLEFNNTKSSFNLTKIINRFKTFCNEYGYKAIFGIAFNTLLIIIAIITFFYRDNDKNIKIEKSENNEVNKNGNKKEENNDKTKVDNVKDKND